MAFLPHLGVLWVPLIGCDGVQLKDNEFVMLVGWESNDK